MMTDEEAHAVARIAIEAGKQSEELAELRAMRERLDEAQNGALTAHQRQTLWYVLTGETIRVVA